MTQLDKRLSPDNLELPTDTERWLSPDNLRLPTRPERRLSDDNRSMQRSVDSRLSGDNCPAIVPLVYRFALRFSYFAWTREGAASARRRVAAIVQAEATVDAMSICTFGFVRPGACAREVMQGARMEIVRALPGARLVEAVPDLVGLTEVGRLLGLSRQAMRKYAVSQGSNFPAAVHGVHGAVWHLIEILDWMRAVRQLTVDPALLDVARVAWDINLRAEVQRRRGAGRRHGNRIQSKANPEIIVPSTSSE